MQISQFADDTALMTRGYKSLQMSFMLLRAKTIILSEATPIHPPKSQEPRVACIGDRKRRRIIVGLGAGQFFCSRSFSASLGGLLSPSNVWARSESGLQVWGPWAASSYNYNYSSPPTTSKPQVWVGLRCVATKNKTPLATFSRSRVPAELSEQKARRFLHKRVLLSHIWGRHKPPVCVHIACWLPRCKGKVRAIHPTPS